MKTYSKKALLKLTMASMILSLTGCAGLGAMLPGLMMGSMKLDDSVASTATQPKLGYSVNATTEQHNGVLLYGMYPYQESQSVK